VQIDHVQGWEIPSGKSFDLKTWRGWGLPMLIEITLIDGQPTIGKFRG
jgi:hypothetical protein